MANRRKHLTLDLKLIRIVKMNPILYDFNHRKYADYNSREVIWHKIGDELSRPALECKHRWVNIRDIYRRSLRKSKTEIYTKSYKYDKELSFMKPFFKDLDLQNDTVPDVSDTENTLESSYDDEYNVALQDSQDDYMDDAPESPPAPRTLEDQTPPRHKSKKNSRSVNTETTSYVKEEPTTSSSNSNELDPTDTIDSFLLSIGATLRKFSPYHLVLAKNKIFNVVQEHELQQIMTKQEHSEQL